MTQASPLRWEFGDAWFWIAFGDDKPFPACAFKCEGRWEVRIHPHRELRREEKEQIEDWIKERQDELDHLWNGHLDNVLKWPDLRRQKTETRGDQ